MGETLTGTLHGSTVTLDTVGAPLSEDEPLQGQRVRVVLEPLDDTDLQLSPQQQAQLVKAWAEHGPQGPIDDEGGA